VVHINGEIRVPGQGNNAYIFPGLGLGAIHAGIKRITNDMLIGAAETLAQSVSENQIEQGCLYPPLKEIRDVSFKIALRVTKIAEQNDLLGRPLPADFETQLGQLIYSPDY
jgi:malate dehydrogenase (oxaloacetate-decarboxylating)(NADP+)